MFSYWQPCNIFISLMHSQEASVPAFTGFLRSFSKMILEEYGKSFSSINDSTYYLKCKGSHLQARNLRVHVYNTIDLEGNTMSELSE